ncbi:MAG: (d)CMP kinase [Peptococcaceae bacterium]|nr:(d)CMP kinase [Peptococcaceae bacterium]
MNLYPNIAIDGPAGAGKSTVAKLVAKKLGYIYIDTGAMYRALTLQALRDGVDMHDPEALGRLAEVTPVSLRNGEDDRLRVFLNNEDVSEEIRGPEVSGNVSYVAMVPAVRRRMVELQKAMAEKGGVVMEGRDIGTVVLPDAPVKIFLTATTPVRAKRRRDELAVKGSIFSQEQMEEEIIRRDGIDSTREADPLTKAPDAEVIDSTFFTAEQVADMIIARVQPAG